MRKRRKDVLKNLKNKTKKLTRLKKNAQKLSDTDLFDIVKMREAQNRLREPSAVPPTAPAGEDTPGGAPAAAAAAPATAAAAPAAGDEDEIET